MKILITGGAGFIGSNLTKRLLQSDKVERIIGLDNLSYGTINNVSDINDKRYQLHIGDVTNPFIVKKEKFDVIVHLASQKIPRYTNAYRTIEENNIMLKNIIQKCLRDNSKLVFASTSDVYGKNPNIPFSETSDIVLGPSTIKRWAYALSKLYGEHLIIAHNDEHGLVYSIARFFGSYGPGHNLTWWGGPQSLFIAKALKKEEIEIHGTGQQTRTFTYIKDTVEALSHLIFENKANNEIYNIAGDPKQEISIENLAKLIWRLVNGETDKPKLKYISYETFGKYEDVMRRVPDISKICSHFGYKPRYSIEAGMKETIEWQRKLSKK